MISKTNAACMVFTLHYFHLRRISFSFQTYARFLLHISCGFRLRYLKNGTDRLLLWQICCDTTQWEAWHHFPLYQRKAQFYSGDNHRILSDPHKVSMPAFWRHVITVSRCITLYIFMYKPTSPFTSHIAFINHWRSLFHCSNIPLLHAFWWHMIQIISHHLLAHLGTFDWFIGNFPFPDPPSLKYFFNNGKES